MIKKDKLNIFWVIGIRPNKHIAWMGICMNEAFLKDHFHES
eukprot:CAMPEP_0176392854 /NCGR_PEP_ID=MMETSP0126-20121128/41222_1 /TAXON_ID=141414 ORGANISM="Strombidinopsis acuminatum, Strain SPMC142" /NCGR_SAMPLE_ID=MMETSP0126 /ASSEMBLY_ACC=CAM_ASM_000229 /LENGTH=40 /DNA_ID= /DNA_START= /DNA_END= /DNA_ORIENTATION=